jgi:predicted transposase/invertase (TIGR01784 family)
MRFLVIYNEAIREGKKEGKIEGLKEGRMEIVKNMLLKGLNAEKICSLSGIPLKEVKILIKNK